MAQGYVKLALECEGIDLQLLVHAIITYSK